MTRHIRAAVILAAGKGERLNGICEKGVPHLYYAHFDDSVVPINPIIAEIRSVNGKGIFNNYSLRKELKRTTQAEQIAGGIR